MAKKALLDVLERTIGKYVLNLDAESLNVAVWSGKIELNALELDVRAVNDELDRQAAEAPNFAIPFRVAAGQFQSFQVDVPWAQLMSRPVVLRAQGLTISVEPQDRTAAADFLYAAYDCEAARAKTIIEQRLTSLQVAEEYRQQTHTLRKLAEQDIEGANSTTAGKNSKQSASFGARLARRIIENIQVEISDVHVSFIGNEGSAGVTLQSVQLVTTDVLGRRTFVDRTSGSTAKQGNSFLHKALTIQGLGVYMDDNLHLKKFNLMPIREDDKSLDNDDDEHSYILAPLSFNATLRQADSSVCIDYPKYLLESEVQALSILFSKTQLELVRKVNQQMQPAEGVAVPLFPEYRPLVRVTSASAKEWWRYAYRCIGRLNGRRSWVEFLTAFQKRREYIPLYKRRKHAASCSWIKPLFADEEDRLDELDRDRSVSVEGIMTWRSIADAQAEKEREKHDAKTEKGSIFSSLFGNSAQQDKVSSGDDPPVSLTVDEMKELETWSLGRVADAELSKDSNLCDIKFRLNSLNVSLTSYDSHPLAELNMGAVSAAFDAHADGSYNLKFALACLEIRDEVTPRTFFPSILKNQEVSNVNDESDDAFSFYVSKTENGDQHLILRLYTFEAIASPILLKELKRFVATSSAYVSSRQKTNNPILAKSMSGSVDIFYDASEGNLDIPKHIVAPGVSDTSPDDKEGSTDISFALIKAWRAKTETETAWIIDMDIQAPIIIIPENCTDQSANVLVFNLGQLKLQYGTSDAAPKATKWFEDNKLNLTEESTPLFDAGVLSISNLTFVVGKTDSWRRLVLKAKDNVSDPDQKAIYEPMSLHVEFGVETFSKDYIPRVCAIGVIPQVVLNISPSQVSRILTIYEKWTVILRELSPTPDVSPSLHRDDNHSHASSRDQVYNIVEEARKGSTFLASGTMAPTRQTSLPVTLLFVDINLQRLSLKLAAGDGSGVEANLVSVATTFKSLSDSSSVGRLTMGFFWILDNLRSDHPRSQRLLVHSTLPLAPDLFAKSGYDIIGELDRVGAFERGYEQSKDLADVIFTQRRGNESHNPFTSADFLTADASVDSLLDAKFASLYVNWNPLHVKNMVETVDRLSSFMDSSETEVGSLILSSPSQLESWTPASKRRALHDDVEDVAERTPIFLVRAEMEKFHLCLRSAKDDLPLFLVEMATTHLNMMTSGGDMSLTFVVDDVRLATPDLGITLPLYRTILGLSTGTSGSLLSVNYCNGHRAMLDQSVNDFDMSGYTSYAQIELSHMRFVYLQAQVLALVEYATEGILGALTAQAASSAAGVAVELATAHVGDKLFLVRANGMEVMLPQAAFQPNFVSVAINELCVDYTSFPEPGGGKAQLRMSDVFLSDAADIRLQENSIQMNIEVKIPPDGVGSKEEQTIRAEIIISEAHFALSRVQYVQILNTLDQNIGEADLFIRDADIRQSGSIRPTTMTSDNRSSKLTHAGVAAVETQRRIYLETRFSAISLVLRGVDEDDPIIRLTAVETKILLNLVSDEGRTSCDLTLKDLVCFDERIEAITRQHKCMIYQNDSSSTKDVFSISYASDADQSKRIEMNVGSPRIVFIPDAVAEVLSFFDSAKKTLELDEKDDDNEDAYVGNNEKTIFDTKASVGNEEIEVSYVENQIRPVYSIALRVATGRCSVILVDLGGSSLLPSSGPRASVAISSVAATIAFDGLFDGELTATYYAQEGVIAYLDAQMHATDVEVYTEYGKALRGMVQIVEPAQFSVYLAMNYKDKLAPKIDLRAAALTPLDISLSMKNVALFNAITASWSECFDKSAGDAGEKKLELTHQQAQRIEGLASALHDNFSSDENSTGIQNNVTVQSMASVPSLSDIETKPAKMTSVKFTMPETTFTIINDLQGLDDALVRFTLRNMMAGAQTRQVQGASAGLANFVGFDFSLHTSILADYFDGSTNKWKILLSKPWEVSSRGSRGLSTRFKSVRPSTTIDIESFPCNLSFSEQLLVSLASAKYMWQVYSTATTAALEFGHSDGKDSKRLKRSVAASAARTLITSLPYAIENHSGVDFEFVVQDQEERQTVASGSLEYFNFESPRGKGSGGKRLYGQDVSYEKKLSLYYLNSSVQFANLDSLLLAGTESRNMSGCEFFFDVVKEGKTVVLTVSSALDIHNRVSLPFSVGVINNGQKNDVGTCYPGSSFLLNERLDKDLVVISDAKAFKLSHNFGIPATLLRSFQSDWQKRGSCHITLSISPLIESKHPLEGLLDIRLDQMMFQQGAGSYSKRVDVTCYPTESDDRENSRLSPFVFRVTLTGKLIDGTIPTVVISFEPRAVVENNIPVAISIRTPMPYTFSSSSFRRSAHEQESLHNLEPCIGKMEIFTPGPSIAVTIKCSDLPVAGSSTDWMDGYVDLPLIPEYRLPDPLQCRFPLARKTDDNPIGLRGNRDGCRFYIAEGSSALSDLCILKDVDLSKAKEPDGKIQVSAAREDFYDWTTFVVTVCNYAVDHTGDILFEEVASHASNSMRRSMSDMLASHVSNSLRRTGSPIAAFGTEKHHHRISLLPPSDVPIRLLQLTMEGDDGLKKSRPFRIDDVSISQGGVDATPLSWENGNPSGYFAYRILVNSYQSETHIIPEYVVFNGSKGQKVRIKQPGGAEMIIAAGRIAALQTHSQETATIIVEFLEVRGATPPVRVDSLGLRVAIVKSSLGQPIGSVAIQTVVGARDSRLVVKLGELKLGASAVLHSADNTAGLFSNDFFRLRIQCSELRLTLLEADNKGLKSRVLLETAFDRLRKAATTTPERTTLAQLTGLKAAPKESKKGPYQSLERQEDAVCTILFYRFTVDWQRVFKEEAATSKALTTKDALGTSQRTQLSVIVHKVQLRDENPKTPYPIVFDSTSDISFIDLCVRFKGPLDSDLVKVDLLDLNLAHANGNSEKIIVNTSEEFIWRLLDVANKIIVAAGEFAGIEIELKFDEEHGGYSVAFKDMANSAAFDEESQYSPPKSDTLYDIKRARVSPFTMLVSFKREPQSSRYKLKRGVQGANLMNYFTTRLKFKIDRAELKFSRYEAQHIKGPPDRLIELLTTVYMSRMKLKLVTIMAAASFQDWKSLAARDGGDDEFMDGDILRVTGNIAGNTTNYVLKMAGRGLGQSVSAVTSTLGDGIESATGAIGARAVGAGLNSAISGVGDGVGEALSGGTCIRPTFRFFVLNRD
jgi:hypothetical protein